MPGPIMMLCGEAAKKILDQPKKQVSNRYEIIREAKEELRKCGFGVSEKLQREEMK